MAKAQLVGSLAVVMTVKANTSLVGPHSKPEIACPRVTQRVGDDLLCRAHDGLRGFGRLKRHRLGAVEMDPQLRRTHRQRLQDGLNVVAIVATQRADDIAHLREQRSCQIACLDHDRPSLLRWDVTRIFKLQAEVRSCPQASCRSREMRDRSSLAALSARSACVARNSALARPSARL